MKNIIIVEDNSSDSEKLSYYIRQFFSTINEEIQINIFTNGIDTMLNYTGHEDIVFLDIDLPQISGMELAKEIRKIDEIVTIIFCSNLAQFAIKGYEVNALDYIVKPFEYAAIEHRLKRAIAINKKDTNKTIIINLSSTEKTICEIHSIKYIEKDANYLVLHKENDSYRYRGSIQEYEYLINYGFAYCMKGILVNLAYVEKTTQDSVFLNGVTLPLARQRKKEFIDRLFAHYGGK